MENISIPLISPLSRKYYQYANDDSEKIHHRAEDVRICIEKVCDSIIIQLVKPDTKRKWKDYKLHNKIEACKEFMNPIIVDDLLNALPLFTELSIGSITIAVFPTSSS